jgi:hypothetical protein
MSYTQNTKSTDLEAKVTPIDADVAIIGDSADSGRAKKLTWANLKATLAGLFTTGAASSTDNAIARFDGITGKVIQDSILTIADVYNSGTRTIIRVNAKDGAGVDLLLNGGNSNDAAGGLLQTSGGAAGGANAAGGNNNVLGGVGNGSGAGGAVQTVGGQGGATGNGGGSFVIGGAGGVTSGFGGLVALQGGNGTAGVSNGGGIYIQPGAGSGGAPDGGIYLYKKRGGADIFASLNVGEIATTSKTFTFPNVTGTLGTVVTKTDTGDGTGVEGTFQINTVDNTFKVYADGGWRSLATW